MILVVDNTHRKMRQIIREKLLAEGIPCVVSDLDHADEYMPSALTVVTEPYLLPDVEYISSLNGNDRISLWDEKTDIFKFMTAEFIKNFGEVFCCSKIGRIRTEGKNVIFCGKPLHLTFVEHRILNLLQYAPRWYSREAVAAYCMKDGRAAASAAAVHICNLNSKARRATGFDIIECRRYLGYRLNNI